MDRLAPLLFVLCALTCVCAENDTFGSAGEWSGPFYIVSTDDSRRPNEMLLVKKAPSGGMGRDSDDLKTQPFKQDPTAQWWLGIDSKHANRSMSVWIVATCASKRPDYTFLHNSFNRAFGPGLWTNSSQYGGDTYLRSTLWDLVPVAGHANRFYIVSNAASNVPKEMLFIDVYLQTKSVKTWAFKEDPQAQWNLISTPPTDCSPPLLSAALRAFSTSNLMCLILAFVTALAVHLLR